MTRFGSMIGLVFVACAQNDIGPLLPSDAGLTTDIQTLAVGPLSPPPPTAVEDVAGVTFVPTTARRTSVAIATPMDTPALTQTLWVRQVTRALPDLSTTGVTVATTDMAGMVVWNLQGPQDGRTSALDALLIAIAAPQLSDDSLAAALSTRPHSSDPADPLTLRKLHQETAVRHRLWLSSGAAGREQMALATQAWDAGGRLDAGDVWLDVRAEGWLALASCRVRNVGGSSSATIRLVANGIIQQRGAQALAEVPLAAERWRSGQPDVSTALRRRFDQAPVVEAPSINDCAFQ
jgi:hypothetical protein